jgi:hypothetical protein
MRSDGATCKRGIDLDDIALVELIGTEVEGGYLVRRNDFQHSNAQ